MNIYIREFEDCDGFCVVDIQEVETPVSFSFNLGYLFEWVEDRHHVGFLIDVFNKKMNQELDWSDMELSNIVEAMRTIYLKTINK